MRILNIEFNEIKLRHYYYDYYYTNLSEIEHLFLLNVIKKNELEGFSLLTNNSETIKINPDGTYSKYFTDYSDLSNLLVDNLNINSDEKLFFDYNIKSVTDFKQLNYLNGFKKGDVIKILDFDICEIKLYNIFLLLNLKNVITSIDDIKNPFTIIDIIKEEYSIYSSDNCYMILQDSTNRTLVIKFVGSSIKKLKTKLA